MEIEKCSSRTNKSVTSKTDAKHKKSKRAKKKRSSVKSDVDFPGDVQLTSNEETTTQNNEETTALEVNCETSKDPSSLIEETLMSLRLVNGEQTSINERDLTLDSSESALCQGSTFQQFSSEPGCTNQTMVNSLVQGISSNVRSRLHSKNNSRSRNSNSKQNGGKHSRNSNKEKIVVKPAHLNTAVQTFSHLSSMNSSQNASSGQSSSKSGIKLNESLRWENVLEDSEEERERIAVYKINRRKRYMAAAQAKGLSWAVNCPSVGPPFQLSEDIGLKNFRVGVNSYSDYRPMKSLGVPLVQGMMGATMIEC